MISMQVTFLQELETGVLFPELSPFLREADELWVSSQTLHTRDLHHDLRKLWL